ncbi:hypothetical protein FN846DRAFT_885987 [Sphaerosporella brunnea]|uniref:Uncharacterized protein n=1 Tax=Sphaerosporella brunnea TaxID=1250544 RepID=A0A5J5FBI3_9PEZI|nr:hypothetical protein FN846DRAFT_885987 [Sphaerosporella brunnea]
MAALNSPATSPGTFTGHTNHSVHGLEKKELTVCKASNILLRLPGELHLQISSYLDKDLVSMALAVASDNCTSCILLPYYIPRRSDEKRRLLTIALLTGFPLTTLCWILDVLVVGMETEHAEVLHDCDMFSKQCDQEYRRGGALATWGMITPHRSYNNAYADRVGIINAAAALGKVEVLEALFGRIMSWMDVAELEQGLLTRYPTPIHFACLHAQPHAVRWLMNWYTQHTPAALDVVFSENLDATPFFLALVGFRFPGCTEEDLLDVLNVLVDYPATVVLPCEDGVPWFVRLYWESVVLPAPILRSLLERMPLSADHLATYGGIIVHLASDPSPYSLGCIKVLLKAGLQLPEDCWVNFVTGGIPKLCWMAEKVTGFLPEVPELWSTLLDTLVQFTSQVTGQWANFLSLMEELVTISRRLCPQGFAGDQTLCFAILTCEGVTATPNSNDDSVPTPQKYFRPFVEALVHAGADLDGMWVDGEPRDTRWDTPRMASYRNWTARQLLAEIKRTGRL